MTRLLNLYYRFLTFLATALLAFLVLIVMYQILSRYVPFFPAMSWTGDVATFTFIWLVLVGAIIGVRDRAHFTIDFFTTVLKPAANRVLSIFTVLVTLLVVILISIGGFHFVVASASRMSPSSGISMAWFTVIVVIAGVSMIPFLLQQLWHLVKHGVLPEIETDEDSPIDFEEYPPKNTDHIKEGAGV